MYKNDILFGQKFNKLSAIFAFLKSTIGIMNCNWYTYVANNFCLFQWVIQGCVRCVNALTYLSVTGELLFLEFMNNQQSYLALIDSGAQLNLMSESVLSNCDYKILSTVQVSEIAGVNGVKSKIEKWISLSVNLANGFSQIIKVAVIQFHRPMIIFGMPFLNDVKAKIDFATGVMDTIAGPTILLRIPKSLKSTVQLVYLPQLQEIITPSLSKDQRCTALRMLSKFNCLWEKQRR